jgi:hypothetical protein
MMPPAGPTGPTGHPHMTERRARLIAVLLLALLAATLLWIQIVVFADLKTEIADRGLEGSASSLLRALRENPSAGRVGPLVLAALWVAALAVLQIGWRGVSRLLIEVTRSDRASLMAAAVVAVVAGRFYLDAGLPHQYDAKLHFMRVAETARILAAGEIPDWTFTFYGGYPILRFTGPLFYLLAGALALVTGSAAVGVKLVLGLSHLAGSLLVHRVIRALGGSPRAAFLGAVGVAVCFQRTAEVGVLGRHPVALLYVFLPLLLLVGVRLARRTTIGNVVGFGASAALVLLSHPGLATYGILAASGFTVLLAFGEGSWRRAAGAFGGLALAGGVCVVLTAGLVVPALLDRPSYHIATMYTASGFDLKMPAVPRFLDLIHWRWRSTGAVTYLGLSLVLLALVGILRRADRRGVRLALAGATLALLVFVGGEYLAARSVHFLVPLVAVAAGLGVDRLPTRAFPWIVLIVLLDLGPTTVQSPFRPDLAYDVAFVHRVRRETGPERALRVSLRDGTYQTSPFATAYDSGLAMPTGPFREAASIASYPWILGLLDAVEADLERAPTLGPPTRLALRGLGCSRLLFEDGRRPLLPAIGGPGLEPEPGLSALRVVGASPAVAILTAGETGRLAALPPGDWKAAWRVAPDSLRDAEHAGVETLSFTQEPKRVSLRVRCGRSGSLLLAAPVVPGVEVLRDGRVVDHRPGPFGGLVIDVTDGEHEVVIRHRAPPKLAISRLVSLVGAVLVLLLLLFRRRPSETRG